jgi:transposase-like protein
MKKYENEADVCPVCGYSEFIYGVVSGITENMQINFECRDCRSSWNVLYEATFALNLYNHKNKGGIDDEG